MMMNPGIFPHLVLGTAREHYFVLFAMAGTVALVAGFIGSWAGARMGARRALRDAALRSRQDEDARFARLEQSVDVVAIEMERMSEALRFEARLAAEQRAPSLPSQAPRITTPH